MSTKPSNFDIPESLETVWAALHTYNERCLEQYHPEIGNETWDDICTAMAWITEALGYDISTADDETNGEYVLRQ